MNLEAALKQYFDSQPTAPEHAVLKQGFAAVLAKGEVGFQRDHFSPGHFTASAWLVHPDQQRVLMTHHRKLQRWLQLGGHADGDTDVAAVAMREAEEESGLSALQLRPEIFDLDIHSIPARGDDPEHLHLDVRFVVLHHGDAQFRVSDESLALAWVPVQTLLGSETEPSIRRMAARWLSKLG